MILFEQEVCNALGLPSIPKKAWDGKSSFKDGVCVVKLLSGYDAYAICTFDNEEDVKPRVTRVFAQETFFEVTDIFIVPAYMEVDNVDDMDLDEASKEAARELAKEAQDLTNEKTQEEAKEEELNALPEWVFPEVHNADEAYAFITNYHSRNHIRGRVSKNEEALKMRLLAIYQEVTNKRK